MIPATLQVKSLRFYCKIDSGLGFEWCCCIPDAFQRSCLFWLNLFLLANQSANLDQWQIKPTSYLCNEVNFAYHFAKISSFYEILVVQSAREWLCQNCRDDTKRKRTIKRPLVPKVSKEFSEAFFNNYCEFVSKISSLKTGVLSPELFIFPTRSNLFAT